MILKENETAPRRAPCMEPNRPEALRLPEGDLPESVALRKSAVIAIYMCVLNPESIYVSNPGAYRFCRRCRF